jgi:hypothetical protein
MVTVGTCAAAVCYAVVIADQAMVLVAARRFWAVGLVAVCLVRAGEVEPAHFGILLALGMFHEERVSSVQGGQVIKITVCFFC